jgi:hypothetical protein
MKRVLVWSALVLMACPSPNVEGDGGSGGGSGSTGGGSGSTGGGDQNSTITNKRGIAYDLASEADLNALKSGVGWSYNWSPTPHVNPDAGIAFVPMLWNFNFNADNVIAYLRAHRDVHYVMVLNEPNLTDQSNQTPQQAADQWPKYEALAADAGVQLVGPQITWGTMPGYSDPVVWMDAFYAAYQDAHDGGSPRIDAIGFHWYDYGLDGQLDRLAKYNKPFWVTEMANWHVGDGTAAIDSSAKQVAQMTAMVETCESRADVARYAWFTGRWNNDPHFTSVLGDAGVLTEVGETYVSLPH